MPAPTPGDSNLFSTVRQQLAVGDAPVQPNPASSDDSANQPAADTSPLAAAIPQAVQGLPDPLNPSGVASGPAKEVLKTTATGDTQVIEAQQAGTNLIESEPSPEISPEVSAYLEKVENAPDQLPQEIVVQGDQMQIQSTHPLPRPIVVLPITPELDRKGSRTSVKNSLRWLVTWSHKMMAIFTGQVMYASETPHAQS